MKKVSIIIPVYNVQNYLSFCLDSIISQTYQNIEIILVNDGSTDLSLSICEKYAERDSRIIIISQENRGLSGARNTGLCYASGEYITFVDSDDYVSINYVESLVSAMKKNTLITACLSKIVYSYDINKINVGYEESEGYTQYVSTHDYFELAFRDVRYLSAWGKMYKASLFDNIRFPEGKLHEDIFIMGDLLTESEYIGLINKRYYFYVKRNGSITTGGFSNHKFDLIEANNIFLKKVNSQYTDLYIESKAYEIHAKSSLIKQMNKKIARQYSDFVQFSIKEARSNIYSILTSKKVAKKEKLMTLVTCSNYHFISFCWKVFDYIKYRTNNIK